MGFFAEKLSPQTADMKMGSAMMATHQLPVKPPMNTTAIIKMKRRYIVEMLAVKEVMFFLFYMLSLLTPQSS